MPKKVKQSWKSLDAAKRELKGQWNASTILFRHNLHRLPDGHVKENICLSVATTSFLLGESETFIEQTLPKPDRKGKVRFKILIIDGAKYVCALSGHSIPYATSSLKHLHLVDDLTWSEIKNRGLIHATTPKGFAGITTSGFLEPMGRAIHFASTNCDYKTYKVPAKTTVPGGGHFEARVEKLQELNPLAIFYAAENGVVLCDTKLSVQGFEWIPNKELN